MSASRDTPSVKLQLELMAKVPLYPAEKAAGPATVCVTGATGYIAGVVIERLLRAGHTVHATFRGAPSRAESLTRLRAIPGASDRLKFFPADLTAPGSFDAAVAGCDYVIHMAAPVTLSHAKRGQGRTLIVDPMVQGVENVLGAVTRAGTVRRVVMTSSVAALASSSRDNTAGWFGEGNWNKKATPEYLPYLCGKTRSEQRAWELAADSDWELVTILPSFVMGPTVEPCTGSEDVQFFVRLSKGELWPLAPDSGMGMVDVRDVAAAHCLAMVAGQARGRYIVSNAGMTLLQLTRLVGAAVPGFRPALGALPNWLLWLIAPLFGVKREVAMAIRSPAPMYDSTRVCGELGMSYRPMPDTLGDMFADLADKGLIQLPRKAQGQVAQGQGQGQA